MIFRETSLAGAFVIEPEPHVDFRGLFARTWCREEFAAHGLATHIEQRSVSYNERRGTLRGMHYQAAPFAEVKLVRCIRGAIFDVIIDLRRSSTTFLHHFSVELTEANRWSLYIPEGFAHGWQSLVDHSEVEYQMSAPFSAAHARGVRWNDPAFGIEWPIASPILIERDAQYPDLVVEALV
jgi:dTDP-4-dehydrorhamnose 3,5-epimerase